MNTQTSSGTSANYSNVPFLFTLTPSLIDFIFTSSFSGCITSIFQRERNILYFVGGWKWRKLVGWRILFFTMEWQDQKGRRFYLTGMNLQRNMVCLLVSPFIFSFHSFSKSAIIAGERKLSVIKDGYLTETWHPYSVIF